MGCRLKRLLRIARLLAIGIGIAFSVLILLIMLIITFSPNQ